MIELGRINNNTSTAADCSKVRFSAFADEMAGDLARICISCPP
jgi:hypothetical protein